MNQALSGEVPQIIPDDPSSTSSDLSSVLEQPISSPFKPYLLVQSIASSKRKREWKKEKAGTAPKNVNLVSAVQDFMMPQIMEVDEEPDVQIVGYSPPTFNNNTAPSLQQIPAPLQTITSAPIPVAKKQIFWDSITGEDGTSSPLPHLVSHKTVSFADKPQVLNSNTKDDNQDCVEDGKKEILSGLASLAFQKEGRVAQCIELPPQVSNDQYVSSVTPTVDGNHIIVITSPKILHRRISALCCLTPYGSEDGMSSDSKNQQDGDVVNTQSQTRNITSDQYLNKGGCVLVYEVNSDSGSMVLLNEKPLLTSVIDNISNSIMSVLLLPKDIAQSQSEEVESQQTPITSAASATSKEGISPVINAAGKSSTSAEDCLNVHMAVTTYSGEVRLMRLSDCKVVATIPAPENEKFISVTYCSGKLLISHS